MNFLKLHLISIWKNIIYDRQSGKQLATAKYENTTKLPVLASKVKVK